MNIAELQGIGHDKLNQMAKSLGVENYGTMRSTRSFNHPPEECRAGPGVLFHGGRAGSFARRFRFPAARAFNYLEDLINDLVLAHRAVVLHPEALGHLVELGHVHPLQLGDVHGLGDAVRRFGRLPLVTHGSGPSPSPSCDRFNGGRGRTQFAGGGRGNGRLGRSLSLGPATVSAEDCANSASSGWTGAGVPGVMISSSPSGSG